MSKSNKDASFFGHSGFGFFLCFSSGADGHTLQIVDGTCDFSYCVLRCIAFEQLLLLLLERAPIVMVGLGVEVSGDQGRARCALQS